MSSPRPPGQRQHERDVRAGRHPAAKLHGQRPMESGESAGEVERRERDREGWRRRGEGLEGEKRRKGRVMQDKIRKEAN